jgi:hypothetical protein
LFARRLNFKKLSLFFGSKVGKLCCGRAGGDGFENGIDIYENLIELYRSPTQEYLTGNTINIIGIVTS